MKRLAVAKTPTVLVNITDKRLAARSEAVSSVWTDNGCLRNAPEVRHQIGLPVYKPEIEKDIIVYQLIYQVAHYLDVAHCDNTALNFRWPSCTIF